MTLILIIIVIIIVTMDTMYMWYSCCIIHVYSIYLVVFLDNLFFLHNGGLEDLDVRWFMFNSVVIWHFECRYSWYSTTWRVFKFRCILLVSFSRFDVPSYLGWLRPRFLRFLGWAFGKGCCPRWFHWSHWNMTLPMS